MPPVSTVAIVGAGTMGSGIAMACANAGITVVLTDTEQAGLDRAMATIRKNYDGSVKKGRFTAESAAERIGRIRTQVGHAGFETADVIIEAVFESMALKKEVLAQLDAWRVPGACSPPTRPRSTSTRSRAPRAGPKPSSARTSSAPPT